MSFGSAPASASRATSSPSRRPAAASAAESASGKDDALVVDDPRAALLARDRPGGRLLEQPPHRAAAARGDPEPLLGEPRALQLVAAADAADHRVVAEPTPLEADRRVPVRIGVGERRVVDHARSRAARPRRGTASARRRQRHHDVDRGDVAVGDEPLLAVEPPAAVDPRRGGRDARRVGARVLLGDRVRVVQLAAQRRAAASGRSAPASRGRARCRPSGRARTARWSSGRTAPRRGTTRRASSPARRARARAARRRPRAPAPRAGSARRRRA